MQGIGAVLACADCNLPADFTRQLMLTTKARRDIHAFGSCSVSKFRTSDRSGNHDEVMVYQIPRTTRSDDEGVQIVLGAYHHLAFLSATSTPRCPLPSLPLPWCLNDFFSVERSPTIRLSMSCGCTSRRFWAGFSASRMRRKARRAAPLLVSAGARLSKTAGCSPREFFVYERADESKQWQPCFSARGSNIMSA